MALSTPLTTNAPMPGIYRHYLAGGIIKQYYLKERSTYRWALFTTCYCCPYLAPYTIRLSLLRRFINYFKRPKFKYREIGLG